MSTENNQLVTGSFSHTPFAIRPEVLEARDGALAASALIGKVETTAQNEQSSAARRTIKTLLTLFETKRKQLKEPILEAGRQLDRCVASAVESLAQEDGRLAELERGFHLLEERRRREEERLQQEELAKIEREKQAELLRIAREQAAAEQKAQEAAEAAKLLASEAKNKKQREAAEAARLEAERQRLAAEETARQQSQLALENAAQAAYIESKPPEVSRARGQSVRKVWIIDQINDHLLYKSCPDLVSKFQWDVAALKERLEERGGKIPGVTAHEDISVHQRGGRAPATLDV